MAHTYHFNLITSMFHTNRAQCEVWVTQLLSNVAVYDPGVHADPRAVGHMAGKKDLADWYIYIDSSAFLVLLECALFRPFTLCFSHRIATFSAALLISS